MTIRDEAYLLTRYQLGDVPDDIDFGDFIESARLRNVEIVMTPAGTTQTMVCDAGDHQTLKLTTATGAVTFTMTVPTGGKSAAGTLIIKQHAAAAKDLTWAVSSGSIIWMGGEADWGADPVDAIRMVAWRFDGTDTYLAITAVNG